MPCIPCGTLAVPDALSLESIAWCRGNRAQTVACRPLRARKQEANAASHLRAMGEPVSRCACRSHANGQQTRSCSGGSSKCCQLASSAPNILICALQELLVVRTPQTRPVRCALGCVQQAVISAPVSNRRSFVLSFRIVV
eukprot:6655249-Prymnesium_polylepis.3